VFGGEICCCPLVEAGTNLHVEGSNQQDAYQDEVVHTQVTGRGSVLMHISVLKEIVADLTSMEVV
jgi:hypothetical protein